MTVNGLRTYYEKSGSDAVMFTRGAAITVNVSNGTTDQLHRVVKGISADR